MNMNSGMKDSFNVFSNFEGRTIMSIKPKTYLMQDSTEKRKMQKKLKGDSETKSEVCITNYLPDVSGMSLFKKTKTDYSTESKDNSSIKIISSLEQKLKLKEIAIKNLEKKVRSKDSDSSYSVMGNLNDLLLDFNLYVEQEMKIGNEESIGVKKSLLRTLSSIQENLTVVRRNQENILSRDRQGERELKEEIEKCREREVVYLNKLDKYSVEISLLEKEVIDLKKSKKIERVKKVIEANSDSFLAKENADLKRRLEISCKFLLKKKEKIEKLNEKINSLNKKINEIIKSTTFSENEETKIIERLSKKMKHEHHPFTNDATFSLDYERRNLSYRTEKLKEKYKDLTKEIAENGTADFVKHYSLVDKEEQDKLIEFMCDQMLSHMDFAKRLNKLCNFFSDCLNFTKEEFIIYVRLKFVELFDAERATLWIYEQHSNEFYTVVNFHKHSESGNDPYFLSVAKGGVYNKYKDALDPHANIYSESLERNFSCQNTKSVLSHCLVDSAKGRVYGILEAVNSNNVIFGYDEEYLIYVLSDFIRNFLIKFSIEEAENKHKTKDTIYNSIISIMLQKNVASLCNAFQKEIVGLIDACESRIILLNGQEQLTYYSKDCEEINFSSGGIAGLTIKSRTGVYCKFPNEDENYNPLIDIESRTNTCFYSIPLSRDPNGIFAILQFITERDDTTNGQYKTRSSHQISKLDYYREKIIDVMSLSLQNALVNIKQDYFYI